MLPGEVAPPAHHVHARTGLGRGQAFGVVVVVVEGLDDLAVDGGIIGLSGDGEQAEKQQPL